MSHFLQKCLTKVPKIKIIKLKNWQVVNCKKIFLNRRTISLQYSVTLIFNLSENTMKIRFKIISGFLILVAMLVVAGFMSIFELRKISNFVQSILDDNYTSIHACGNMLEALEREDSGILLILNGNLEHGTQTLNNGDSMFLSSFAIAENNITEPNEKYYIDSIKQEYLIYKDLLWKPNYMSNNQENFKWYSEVVHDQFQKVKLKVKSLQELNQNSMYFTASHIRDRAKRAIMPGIVAIAAALAFALIFNFFINLYIVSPILRITNGIEKFNRWGTEFDIEIDTKDELFQLAKTIRTMLHNIQTHKP